MTPQEKALEALDDIISEIEEPHDINNHEAVIFLRNYINSQEQSEWLPINNQFQLPKDALQIQICKYSPQQKIECKALSYKQGWIYCDEIDNGSDRPTPPKQESE